MNTETGKGMKAPERERRLGSYASLMAAQKNAGARKRRLDSYAGIMDRGIRDGRRKASFGDASKVQD